MEIIPNINNDQCTLQINEDTGTTRPVQRCNGNGDSSATSSSKAEATKVDSRIAILQQEAFSDDSFTHKLFACLYSILNSSVGIAIRNRCVNSILRMIYYAPAELLKVILKRHPVSSIIGGMLQSHDIRTIVNALQLAEILMQKLPDIFHISFRREGVMHKAKSLADESFLDGSHGKNGKKCSAAAPVLAGEPYSSHFSHPIQVFEKPPSPPSRYVTIVMIIAINDGGEIVLMMTRRRMFIMVIVMYNGEEDVYDGVCFE